MFSVQLSTLSFVDVVP